jgi:hypothetical protein
MGNDGRKIIRRMDQSRVVPASEFTGNLPIKLHLEPSRRIAIGKKGDRAIQKKSGQGSFRPPIKLDYFLVTKLERDERDDFVVDHHYHKEVLKDEKPRELPIKLLFDPIGLNASTKLGLYAGRRPWCLGNGKVAMRLVNKDGAERKQVDCTCEFFTEKRQCKLHLRFQFHLLRPDGESAMGLGELAVFRSTGKYTISSILGSLHFIKEHVAMMLGVPFDQAPLAGIPLVMKYGKRTVPGPEGQMFTIPIVSVVYEGSQEKLFEVVKKRQDFYQKSIAYTRQLTLAQKQSDQLLLPEPEKEAAEIAEEFHPDQDVPKPTTVIDAHPTKEAKTAEAEEFKKTEEHAKAALPDGLSKALEAGPEDVRDEFSEESTDAPPTSAKPEKHGKPPRASDESFL